jgi:cell division protein FtsB
VAYRAGSEPLSKQLTIVVGLTVVGFMAFGLALSFYRNILFEKTLKEMEIANKGISQENDDKYRELDYYRSDQFKDKYAKVNLGLVNPGEHMLIITNPPPAERAASESGSALSAEREAKFMELLRQMPVHEQWWLYLFDREKLNQLKETI